MSRTSPILRLEDRIARLRPILAGFKITHDTRQLLFNLECAPGGRYCAVCSPISTPGSCGRTCSLLSPRTRSTDLLSPRWIWDMESDRRLYQQIIADIDRHELDSTENRVSGWERATNDLRRYARNESELSADLHWRDVPELRPTPGLNGNWIFETAWTDEGEVEEEVPMSPGRPASPAKSRSLKRRSNDSDSSRSKRRSRKWALT
ncbi:hypothetical protein CC86DRAFT_308137 [Ophiobolus disseminans]|uniref:Uncharacterized protein n=1 Tax=Ophiobolus disseminans TaxID=1469910 RepID=A0A6A6ZFF0_9PLEO|nr:hypothetical protein CC86DRAFT_308137 [Ophiobolus disseminans]